MSINTEHDNHQQYVELDQQIYHSCNQLVALRLFCCFLEFFPPLIGEIFLAWYLFLFSVVPQKFLLFHGTFFFIFETDPKTHSLKSLTFFLCSRGTLQFPFFLALLSPAIQFGKKVTARLENS